MKKSFYLLCATLLTFIPAHSQNRFNALAVASKLRTINVSELSANNSERTVPTEFAYTKFDYVVEGKVEYDQYGRVIGLKQDESNYETITYEDDNSGKWTTQTISKVANGTENARTQTARKFDKQGRITSFEQLVFNFDAQKWEPTHSLAYDYEHTDNEGVATVIKDITYSKYNNGTTCRTGYDSFWYEPNQGFLKSEYTPSHSQEYYLTYIFHTHPKRFRYEKFCSPIRLK